MSPSRFYRAVFSLFALCALSACIAIPGPPVYTVADALKANGDTQAVLVGNIIRKFDGNRYVSAEDMTLYEFRDSTGTMPVDIEKKLIPDQKINEHTTVKIVGKVYEFDPSSGPNHVNATQKVEVLN